MKVSRVTATPQGYKPPNRTASMWPRTRAPLATGSGVSVDTCRVPLRGRSSQLMALLLVGAAAVTLGLIAITAGHGERTGPPPTPSGSEKSGFLAPPVPPSREGTAMAYDAFRSEVVLFGGSTFGDHSVRLNDTWVLRGWHWTERDPVVRPGPLDGAQMAYDAATHSCLLVWSPPDGGLAVTWRWDGSTWIRLPNVPFVANEGIEAVVSDPTTGHVLMISVVTSPVVNVPPTAVHTWTWDGDTWSLRHPQRSFPVTNGRPTLATVGARVPDRLGRGVLAVFTAEDGTTQTWLWDGMNWSLRARDVSAPPYDALAVTMAEDPATQSVVLIGVGDALGEIGSTWVWNSTAWRQAGPAPLVDSLYGGAWALTDGRSDHAIVIGHGAPDLRPNKFDVLWSFDGQGWVRNRPA